MAHGLLGAIADLRSNEMADEAETETETETETKPPNKKLIIIFALLGLVMVGVSVGLTLFLVGGDKSGESVVEEPVAEEQSPAEEQPLAKAIYMTLAPPFVVNFQSGQGRTRFLQVSLEAMTRDEAVLNVVKLHMPLLRNNLILLFSKQKFEDLLTAEGKQKLRAEVLAEIQKVVEKEYGKPAVEDVYFTSFVIQ